VLRTLSRPLVTGVERYLPSSLFFAVALTGIVGVLALALTGAGPVDVIRGWGDGLTGLLAFMAQISLVLFLGYILANTRPVQAFLVRIAGLPRSPVQAYAFVTAVTAVAALVSWGLGLVVGGVLSLEVARNARERGVRLHYPLLVACAYSGFLVWHMGYSGSGPLAAATPGQFVEEQIGRTIPVSETIFSWWNIVAVVVTVAAVTAAMVALRPKNDERVHELAGEALEASRLAPEEPEPPRTPAERVDASRAVTTSAGVALVAYLVVYFAQEGFTLTLDIVNWTFLAAILLIVRSPVELSGLVGKAARTVGEVLLQYPLYAGILGMMTATGLVDVFSDFFVEVSGPATLGLFAFLAGGLLNLFVPSGGGQFAVQAPVFLDAAERLGVDPAVVTMAIAYGDQWTNMVQPFWAIPLLAIARLGIRDILGYTAVTLLVSGVVFAATLLVVS
jgi:short-chain fatty acids transporter